MNPMIASSVSDLDAIARKLLIEHPKARIFAFFGEMGAGKTTLIKAICSQLKVVDNVASPTFSIINEYRSESGFLVYHFDFYRIKKFEEAFDLGYEEYFYSGAYCFIEWPELIEPLLPEETIRVKINVDELDGSRTFNF